MAGSSVINIFIDTSVLFSACDSPSGASAMILGQCRKKTIKGYISAYVVSEAKKNVSVKLDQLGKQRLNVFLLRGNFKMVKDPTKEEIERYKKIINSKDAPILTSAIKCKADYLITLDTTDFFQSKIRETVKPLTIVTPGHFVKKVLKLKS